MWDLRRIGAGQAESEAEEKASAEVLQSVEAVHEAKYDEGVQALTIHPTQPFLATGGADSIIKVFEMYA